MKCDYTAHPGNMRLGKCMQSEMSKQLQQDGFAFLEGYRPEMDASNAAHLFGEADAIGTTGSVHELKPATVEGSAPNTYSGNYGFGIFPLHTDMAHWQIPPRYLMLRCLVGSSDVSTSLIDGLAATNIVGEIVLSRALVK